MLAFLFQGKEKTNSFLFEIVFIYLFCSAGVEPRASSAELYTFSPEKTNSFKAFCQRFSFQKHGGGWGGDTDSNHWSYAPLLIVFSFRVNWINIENHSQAAHRRWQWSKAPPVMCLPCPTQDSLTVPVWMVGVLWSRFLRRFSTTGRKQLKTGAQAFHLCL